MRGTKNLYYHLRIGGVHNNKRLLEESRLLSLILANEPLQPRLYPAYPAGGSTVAAVEASETDHEMIFNKMLFRYSYSI